MPIYDYHCDHCGHAFSAVRSFADDTIPACPKCGSTPRRLITAPSIVFKGSGWYKTDSRHASGTSVKEDSSKDAASKDAGSKDAAPKDAPAAADAKPAAAKSDGDASSTKKAPAGEAAS